MAESSSTIIYTTISHGSTPISKLAEDHLISILLLLPIQSVISFGLTCKRFRSLAYSDALWESICRKEWGHTSVDAINSSSVDARHQRFPSTWIRLFRQVYQLDTLSCHRLTIDSEHVDALLPGPRASHSLNFVSDCLVLFGGGCEGGRHLDDTWVAYIGNNFKRTTVKWKKINSSIPSGRFGHSCVVIGDCIVLHGGINDRGVRHNDTWVGRISFHESFGITWSWRMLDVGSTAPPPRGAHAACCIDNNRRMIIHGGIGLSGHRLGDGWVLDLSENLLFGTWSEITTHPSPEARSGHTLTFVGGNRAVLFGGRGMAYDVLDDVWLLDSSENRLRWVQLEFELGNINERVSLPRVGHTATVVLGGRVLIYGGEDSSRHRKDDFWVLDVCSSVMVVKPRRGLVFRNMWKRMNTTTRNIGSYGPKGRSFHRACTDQTGRFLYVFGGMVDGILQPGESSGLRFDAELFVVELVL